MTPRFEHVTLAQHVVFAPGEASAALAERVRALGVERLMVVAAEPERELAHRITAGLPVVVHHHEVRMHVPVEFVARAREVAARHDADALVTVGGGSTTGLAKAVALADGLPIVAVPTTYAGSEATNVWGTTEGSRKVTGTDDRVLPRAVVYDASLTTTLPVPLSVASGLNAFAHCVDSMWAPRADPIDRVLAQEAMRALATGLRAVVADPDGLPGRQETLYGAHLAAVAFASAGSGLHHKICHVLGGMFDLPHAQTHAVVLPHVLRLNVSACPEAETRIARALGATSATRGLADLLHAVAAPVSLAALGMPADGVAPAAEAVLGQVPPGNPAPVDPATLTQLLQDAWKGGEPACPS